MPLVLLTGYPNSGKTTVSKQLINDLEELIIQKNLQFERKNLKIPKIKYFQDDTLGINHEDYSTALSEKQARNKIFSTVKRLLNKSDIVLIDSLNYIKGFRYQLHCEVKNCNTTFALIHVMSSLHSTNTTNEDKFGKWDPKLYEELVARYEEPNNSNRWDTPYFPLLISKDQTDSLNVKDLFEKLYPQFIEKTTSLSQNDLNKLKQSTMPNSATILNPASQSNYLTLLDQTTSTILTKINKWLSENQAHGDNHRFVISGLEDGEFIDIPPQVHLTLNISKLQRLKRQFITMNRIRILGDSQIISRNFIQYLNKNFNSEIL